MASSSKTLEEIKEWVKKARDRKFHFDGNESWNDYSTGYSDALGELLEFLGEPVVFLI